MKLFFRFCIPKILFFLLVTHTEIRPAAMVTAAMATEELAALTRCNTRNISSVQTA